MAMQVAVNFRMCVGKSICKSEREIRDWLSGKYIVLLYNSLRFKTDDFGSDSIVKEARIIYVPINS